MLCIPKRLTISEIELRILQVIAEKHDRTYYSLWKKDKVAASNKTVQVALKRLQIYSFISPIKKTRGTEKKPYEITLTGLILVLAENESWKNIDKIAVSQKDKLPLIFGKWPFFREKGIKHIIVERLKSEIFSISQDQRRLYDLKLLPDRKQATRRLRARAETKDLFTMSYGNKAPEIIEDYSEIFKQLDQTMASFVDPTDDITQFVLGFTGPYQSPEAHIKFMFTLKQDPDLRDYISKLIIKEKKKNQKEARTIAEWETQWNKLPSTSIG